MSWFVPSTLYLCTDGSKALLLQFFLVRLGMFVIEIFFLYQPVLSFMFLSSLVLFCIFLFLFI